MITIKAVSYNGQPTTTALNGEFNEVGGVIGRAEGNALVLPDPERYVSRTHAMVIYRNGTYAIRDLSSASPVYVNGKPLGHGNEIDLADGDELCIGAYTLKVEQEAPAKPAAAPAIGPIADPLELFGSSSPQSSGKPGIPEDFDIFGEPFSVSSAAAPDSPAEQTLPEDFGLGLSPASGSDINKLFDLGPGSSGKLFPAGHPLSEDGGNEQGASSVDPLVAIGAVAPPQPPPPSQRDDTPELRGSFNPPVAKPAPAPEVPAAANPQGMVVSWSADDDTDSGGAIKTMIVQSPLKGAKKPLQASKAPPVAAVPATDHVVPLRQPAAAAKPKVDQSYDEADLLQAFLVGAGVPELDMKGPITPQTMQMLGQLLRESTQGTLDLLLSRALIKREIRAEMTMIVTRENNPLKFSPNVEAALAHMLAPRGQGFMPPLVAMKDAYDDLRAHQFAFMAGMRAALAGVLRRFDPEPLEKRLTEKSLLDTVLPLNRKAKLWGLYAEMYSAITKEAEDDFHTWFGHAFLNAYQAQLDKLAQADKDAAK